MTLAFLQTAPEGTGRTMQVLAAAESLTDSLAAELYQLAPVSEIDADFFLRALKQAAFVEPRNSEWSFSPRVRQELLRLDQAGPELVREAHEFLLAKTTQLKAELAGSIIPNYLYTLAGRAYHAAGAGQISEALQEYERVSLRDFNSEQWLAARLADEQSRLGVIPADRIEILFLRAVTLYRQGRRDEARPLLERVAASDAPTLPRAVSLNMLGNLLAKQDPERAERLLREGIEVSHLVGNAHGVTIGLHNLGKLLENVPARWAEAEQFLLDSISRGQLHRNTHHVGQARHSLGHLLAKMPHRRAEAETALRTAIEELEEAGDHSGAAQGLHTLALLVGRDDTRLKDAEDILQRSLRIGRQSHDDAGMAMRYLSLAQLLSRKVARLADALAAIEQSLAYRRSMGNKAEIAKGEEELRRIQRLVEQAEQQLH